MLRHRKDFSTEIGALLGKQRYDGLEVEEQIKFNASRDLKEYFDLYEAGACIKRKKIYWS